jgi:hypothetical protein
MSRCAHCNQDLDVELCGHVANDPKVTPDIAKVIFVQSIANPPVKPSVPAEPPDQNKH